ncbi:hypothetical protein CGZ94_14090 [Enemella evansiae]|uniref:Lrp/AsnC family transcriptional regulator n=1 Tax=Enemella evansiae TaxID=2016499 RepID=A0A255G7P5_9ACTN|nr:hypothetical protein CGZ94_14090 [Enemella evansiae]
MFLNETAPQVNELDKRIVGALLAHPRATNAQLADAAITSPATVSRRVTRLLTDRTLWVTGVLDDRKTQGAKSLFVRLRCGPGNARTIAERLAQWPECGSVKLLTGSVDAVAEISYTTQDHLLDLTMEQLPAMEGVRAIWSNQVIRRYATPHQWAPALLPAETIAELRALRADRWDDGTLDDAALSVGPVATRVAATLRRDGRKGWQQIARECGISAATARHHVEALMASGALRMRTVIEPEAIGARVNAFVWLNVVPTKLGAAGAILARHPDVLMIAATTGDRNLCGEIAVASEAGLYDFISQTIGSLPGLQHADVAISLLSLKRAGQVIEPGG